MSTPSDLRDARRVLRHELEVIRGQWAWLLALGIVLVVVGTLAIGAPFVASLATALTLGVLLVAGGIAQLHRFLLDARLERLLPHAPDGPALRGRGPPVPEPPGLRIEALTLLLACP